MTKSWKFPPQGRRIGFVGKGGSGKSTTLAHLLGHWAREGVTAIGVDMDRPGEGEPGSLYAWADLADLGAPIYPAPDSRHLRKEAERLTPPGGLAAIDTGAWHRMNGGTHMQVLSAVDLAVLTLQPTDMEMERAGSVLTAIDHLEAIGGHVPRLVVLLTMVNNSASSPADTRAALADAGLHVLTAEVPRSDSRTGYGQAFGKPPRLTAGSPMDRLATELLHEVTRETSA